MKRKLEKTKVTTLFDMPNEILDFIAECASHDPLKLLIIISSLSKGFYKELSLITKRRAIESLTIQQIVSTDDSKFYIMATGEVFACGKNKFGQLGIGNTENQPSPVKLSLPAVSQIAAGYSDLNTFFLTKTGEVFACGSNEHGSLGIGNNIENQSSPVKLSLPAVSLIVTNDFYAFFLTQTNEVYVCGSDECGQLGVGIYNDGMAICTSPIKLILPAVSQIETDGSSTFFITTTGEVFACGYNKGQLGIGNSMYQHFPVKLSLPAISQIVFNYLDNLSVFFLTTIGEVFACGDNKYRQLGIWNTENQHSPVKLSLPVVSQIVTNVWNCCSTLFLTTAGEVFVCGYVEKDSSLAIEIAKNQGSPVKLSLPSVLKILMNSDHAFFHTTAGEVFESKEIEKQLSPVKLLLPVVSQIETDGSSIFFITTTGEVLAYDYGQLGIGNTYNQPPPVKLSLFDKATKVVQTWDVPTLYALTTDFGPNRQLFWSVLKKKINDLNPANTQPCPTNLDAYTKYL
jgi:alpha-tubulin suppressor-like RCC1 family protein